MKMKIQNFLLYLKRKQIKNGNVKCDWFVGKHTNTDKIGFFKYETVFLFILFN